MAPRYGESGESAVAHDNTAVDSSGTNTAESAEDGVGVDASDTNTTGSARDGVGKTPRKHRQG